MITMTDYYADFPYDEIRDPNGDMFHSAEDAVAAGYPIAQVWSVVEGEMSWVYGPPRHRINVVGYIATVETHDDDTYYHETWEAGEDDSL